MFVYSNIQARRLQHVAQKPTLRILLRGFKRRLDNIKMNLKTMRFEEGDHSSDSTWSLVVLLLLLLLLNYRFRK